MIKVIYLDLHTPDDFVRTSFVAFSLLTVLRMNFVHFDICEKFNRVFLILSMSWICFRQQTFHDKKHLDEEALYGKTEADLSSPSELAEALQSRVFGTSRMVSLVNILQDLLAIETLEKSDK